MCVGPPDDNFDQSIPHSVDSPISINEEGHPPVAPGGGVFGMGGEGGDGDKKQGIDELLSKEAVKIDGNLEQIFEDSEEEDEGPPVSYRGAGGF